MSTRGAPRPNPPDHRRRRVFSWRTATSLRQAEREKYERVWRIPSYGDFSPGERLVDAFIDIVKPEPDSTITDFGCGSGKASRLLQRRGFNVLSVDHTKDGISRHRARHIDFAEACLWDIKVPHSRYGFCCDVMEHIPIEMTMLTIKSIMDHCDECFFQICTLPDRFGQQIGIPLHLTVKPFVWWRDRLSELTTVIDARDLMHAGIFHVRHNG